MNVLVACHCKHKHDPVYLSSDITTKNPKYYNLYDADELEEAKRVFGIDHIDYIEKRECTLDVNQHRDWNKLPRKYDMIVSVHCPLYSLLHSDSYKYIDSIRDFYKDIRKNLKPTGFFQLPYNLSPKSWLNKLMITDTSRKTQKMDLEYHKRHNSNKNIKTVMKYILEDGNNPVNYKLEIIDYKNRTRIPFFIDTDKNGTWSKNSKSTFRHIVLSFPPSLDTNSKKTKKINSIRKKTSSKTRKHHIH